MPLLLYQDQDELMLHNHYKLSHSQVLTASLQHAVSLFYQEGNFSDAVTLDQSLSLGQADHVCSLH